MLFKRSISYFILRLKYFKDSSALFNMIHIPIEFCDQMKFLSGKEMYLYKLKDYPFAFDLQCQSFLYISLLSLEFSDPLNENNNSSAKKRYKNIYISWGIYIRGSTMEIHPLKTRRQETLPSI